MRVEVILKRRNGKVDAKGVFEEGQFTVEKGSTISEETHFDGYNKILKLRSDKEIVENCKLKKDIVFRSASAAGAFVTGTSTNGMKAWKTLDGRPLSETISG